MLIQCRAENFHLICLHKLSSSEGYLLNKKYELVEVLLNKTISGGVEYISYSNVYISCIFYIQMYMFCKHFVFS